jgi:hypothetical protein
MSSEVKRRRFTFEHPAYKNLAKAIDELQKAQNLKDVPISAAMFVENASSLVRGAIDVLLEHDPLKQELGVIVVLMRESLSRSMQKIDGQMKEVYEIKDEYLLGLAASKAFALPSKFG